MSDWQACARCGTGFLAQRSTARWCSEACKKAAKRERERDY